VPPPPVARRRNLSPSTQRTNPIISLDKFSTSPDPSSDDEDANGEEEGDEEEDQVEQYGSDSDDEAKHEQMMRDRRRHNQEFGSVQGGPWQSWATF